MLPALFTIKWGRVGVVMKRVMKRPAEAAVLAAFVLAVAVGCTWGPARPDCVGCASSISPRSCGLGAIAETYTPGHWHHYPPLHMAILTVVSLPWMALAAHRVGLNIDALGAELLKPFYMTGIETCSRVVAAAMALGIVVFTMRLWRRIGERGERGGARYVGLAAGVLVATDATFVYYAHNGNTRGPVHVLGHLGPRRAGSRGGERGAAGAADVADGRSLRC